MSKLDTLIEVYNRNDLQCLVKLNLSRAHRSLLARTLCGVAPLMVEVGRFKNIDREDRVCQICDKNVTETESHFVISCTSLEDVRKKHKNKMQGHFDFKNIFRQENLKATAVMLEEMFEERQKLMTKQNNNTNAPTIMNTNTNTDTNTTH